MRMESIHNRTRAVQRVGGNDAKVGKNYIHEAWQLMTKTAKRGIDKVEENPIKAQLWANIFLALSLSVVAPFLAWLGFHLVDFGEQRATQKFYQQQNEQYRQEVEKQQKEIEALKAKQADDLQQTVTPKPKPKKGQSAKGNKSKLNGAVNPLYSKPTLRIETIKLEK